MTSDDLVAAWSRRCCQPASIQFPNFECEVLIRRSCEATPPILSRLSIFYAKSRVQNGHTTILVFPSMRLQSGDLLPSQHIYITTITSKDSEMVETVWDLPDRSVVRATLTMQHGENENVMWNAPQDPLFEYPKETYYERRRNMTATTTSDKESVLSLSLRDGYKSYLRWIEGGPTRPNTVGMGYRSSSRIFGISEEDHSKPKQAEQSTRKNALWRILYGMRKWCRILSFKFTPNLSRKKVEQTST